MIRTQDKLFANLTGQLIQDLPKAPETRVVNLAAVALGVFRSKSLQVGQVVASSPLEGNRDSIKKRVQRFLKNRGVNVVEYQKPLAQRVLGQLVAGGARLELLMDRTEWDDFNVLYVSVGWRGRALPILWQMLGRGASSFLEQRELLAVVASWLPKGAPVVLLGDREFGTGVLAQWALDQGWGICLRLRCHEYVRREAEVEFAMLPTLQQGQRDFWPEVYFTQKHRVSGVNLAMHWATGAKGPWYLITTEPTCQRACATYARRFQIEEMFKDFKNSGRGFGLELTGLRHSDRLSRLLLALALVYTWVLLWGAYVIVSGDQKLVDNVRKPVLSLFQTGLRFINRLRDRGRLVRFRWHLSVLKAGVTQS